MSVSWMPVTLAQRASDAIVWMRMEGRLERMSIMERPSGPRMIRILCRS